MLLRDALQYGATILQKTSDSSALDAEILLSFVLKKNRTFLFTYPEKKLRRKQWQKYKKFIAQRKKYEPIAYIVRHKEFYGLDFYVDHRVLIPRPKTEELVEKVIDYIIETKYKNCCHSESRYQSGRKIPLVAREVLGRLDKSGLPRNNFVICDIGTGSGCIAIVVAKNLPNTKIYATDISEKALEVAKLNAKRHKVLKQIKFIKSDLLSRVPKNIKFDIIIANLPYLSEKKYQLTKPEIKKEPKLALAGGKRGTEIYKKLLKQVKQHLKTGGKIFLENY